jgi:hypothetical protein
MLRKFALVIVAVSSLGVATLTPTPASAWRGAGTAVGMVEDGAGVVDGARDGALAGDLDGDGVAVGDGWATFRRGAGILRRRVCCSASCPWSMGTALDSRE